MMDDGEDSVNRRQHFRLYMLSGTTPVGWLYGTVRQCVRPSNAVEVWTQVAPLISCVPNTALPPQHRGIVKHYIEGDDEVPTIRCVWSGYSLTSFICGTHAWR